MEDETGRIRVEPPSSLTVSFPLLALFTSFLGARPFFAILRDRVRHGWWPNREFFLQDGDPVYVLGTLELERDPKTGLELPVVRPPREARTRESPIDSLMRPFKPQARRAWQDVFVIADTEQNVAVRVLRRHFMMRIFWCLFWTMGPIGLLTAH